MSRICLKNGRVIDPSAGLDERTNVWIAQGSIAALGRKPAGFGTHRTVDCSGLWVLPGVVDLAARLREPGNEHEATIASETRAAAAAGVTTLCTPPDTSPVADTAAVTQLIHHLGEDAGYARVRVLGALTRGLGGTEITSMASLRRAGCVGVSNARRPVGDAMVMRRAMLYARTFDLTVFVEPEDHALAGGGCVHEGRVSTRLGLAGIPEAAELLALSRDLTLVRDTGVRTHFGRLSCARSVALVAEAKQEGLPVTADVAAHQLFLTEMDAATFDANAHLRPPLRTDADRDALRQGVADGVIDVVCSDHQPHDADSKLAPFPSTAPGISSIETLLALGLRLVQEKVMDPATLVQRLCASPARVLGVEEGTLGQDAPADICLVDPEAVWRLETGAMVSRGRNTPFAGWEFTGRVVRTLLGGKTVYQR